MKKNRVASSAVSEVALATFVLAFVPWSGGEVAAPQDKRARGAGEAASSAEDSRQHRTLEPYAEDAP